MGAPESCDGVDSDCDGDLVDGFVDTDGEGTPDCVDGDDDGDAEPDVTDCGPLDPSIYPGAAESCDGVDSDCDGDFVDGFTDTDGDASPDCVDPDDDGDAEPDETDCAPLDPAVYPGATESINGVDDDCDGLIDEGYSGGTGDDGPLSVGGVVDLSTSGLADSWSVVGFSGAEVLVDQAASSLSPGDEVLLLNLQGSDSASAGVGTWEFATVTGVSGSTITLSQVVSGVYGEVTNADLTGQAVILQRVPQFTDVTVAAGGTLTTDGWDGLSGGVLAFRASGTVSVADGGAITVDALGFAGGAAGGASNCDGYQGEGYAGVGLGQGDGSCSGYNQSYGLFVANEGGGGSHITGGGGNYAGLATPGDSWNPGAGASPPAAGAVYGVASLETLFFGSGGGGIWNDGSPSSDTGPGGNGGGVIFIGAGAIEALGTGAITSVGGSTAAWSQGSWTYGAAGGAGGSIYLVASAVDLAIDSIDAQGGYGQSAMLRAGGDGGVGRVRVDCTLCGGFVQGTSSADLHLDGASEPDAGWSESAD